MIKMSDILKKAKEQPPDDNREKSGLSETGKVHVPRKEDADLKNTPKKEEAEKRVAKTEVRISPSILGKSRVMSRDESAALYNDTFALIKEVYDTAKKGKDFIPGGKDINGRVKDFVNQMKLGNEYILSFLGAQNSGDFIYSHALNTSILCIELGIGLKYPHENLCELGVIAMLHDIGMTRYYDIYRKPRRLNRKEYNELKNHTAAGSEILESIRGVGKKAVTIVYQEHERMDGSGYPRGLKKESLDEYTKIIGIADVYEALRHKRPHRKDLNPRDTLKKMIGVKNLFERRALKTLIERICCPYPLGISVRLSSRETAKVVKRNIGMPLRPVVQILREADGEMAENIRVINLLENPTVYINGYPKEESL